MSLKRAFDIDVEEATDTPELDMRVLEQQIKSIKGVGEKRAEEIMVVIEKWMLGE